MTPVFITFMLDVYCLPEIDIKNKAREGALARAKRENLVTKVNKVAAATFTMEITDRGRAYVDLIMEVPLPVAATVYVDPRTLPENKNG